MTDRIFILALFLIPQDLPTIVPGGEPPHPVVKAEREAPIAGDVGPAGTRIGQAWLSEPALPRVWPRVCCKERGERPAGERESQKKAPDTAGGEARQTMEEATVAFVQPGFEPSEKEFNLKGANSRPTRLDGRFGRRGSGWFSFDLPVEADIPMVLVVTYNLDEQQDRSVEIRANGTRIGGRTVKRRDPGMPSGFFDVKYAIPPELIRELRKVTVRFESSAELEMPAVYGIRIIRGHGGRGNLPRLFSER